MSVHGAEKSLGTSPAGEGVAMADAAERMVPAAITDTGCVRDLNEDRYAVVESDIGLAWFVCDGMGGTSGGELAAQLAIEAMRRTLDSFTDEDPEIALRAALAEANRVIVLRRQNPSFASMGTTCAAIMIDGIKVILAHVGDSRAYLVRRGEIEQLTHDHTFVQTLVDRGQITPQEALTHPDAHVLTRCLGASSLLEIDSRTFWINPTSKTPDVLALCSDGLYSHVTDLEIAQAVTEHPPRVACTTLVDLAKERGGLDNITIAIIPLEGKLLDQPPPGHAEPPRGVKDALQITHQSSQSGSESYGLYLLLVMATAAVGSVGGALTFWLTV